MAIDPTGPSGLVAPEPEHCPGPESSAAGSADACGSCPNKEICAANAANPPGPDPDIKVIASRLESVAHKIVVLSGKGGVGKSTFSVLLAHAFAAMVRKSDQQQDGQTEDDEDEDEIPLTVGLLDADITGPSIAKMVGIEDERVHVSASGWTPAYVTDNLAAISIQNLLPPESAADTAVIWRGAKKTGLIKQFLRDVEWGSLDLLLIDTPPGTSDEHLALVSLLKEAGIDGAVVVSTPQEVALLDVRKEIDFCRKAGIPLLGLVENMAGFVCPGCNGKSTIFRPTTGGVRALAKEQSLPFLGSVPIDPRIGLAADFGEDFVGTFPDSVAGRRISRVVRRVAAEIGLAIATRSD